MKLELPLAAVLLAAGCLLWNARPFEPSTESVRSVLPDNAQTAKALADADDPTASSIPTADFTDSSPPFSVVQTRYQEPARDSNSTTPAPSFNEGRSSQAAQLITTASENLLYAASVEAKVRITIRMFEEEVVCEGSYFQMGEGTAKSRLEFTYGKGAEATTVTQICDGRFHYSVTENQNEKLLEFVDLERVARANRSNTGVFGPPTSLMATGGLASLLQNLAAAFDFEQPTSTSLAGVEMQSLRGKWNPSKLNRLSSEKPERTNPSDFDESQVPPQIPHAVNVLLGNDDFLPLFPYRIEFFQPSPDNPDPFSQSVMVLELYEVGKSARLNDGLFTANSNDAVLIDATEQHVARIHHFRDLARKSKQASAPKTTTSR